MLSNGFEIASAYRRLLEVNRPEFVGDHLSVVRVFGNNGCLN